MANYIIGGAYVAIAFGIVIIELIPRIQTEHLITKLSLGAIGGWALIQADKFL